MLKIEKAYSSRSYKIHSLAMVPQAHVASLFAVCEFYQRQRQQIS